MADRLRQERLRAGLGVEEAAARLGVAAPKVAAWESQADEPRGADLAAMARLYGCSPDWLLGVAGERTSGIVRG